MARSLAEKQFDVFITGDLNLNFQQDVTKYKIAVVVLHAESTQLDHMMPLMGKVLALLPTLSPAKSSTFIRETESYRNTPGSVLTVTE